MNLLKGIKSVLNMATGGLAGDAFDIVKDYLPTPEAKAEIKARLQTLELEKEKAITAAYHTAAVDLNKRIADHEGTAKDLKSIPLIGPILIFLRGTQRPVWGFATLYFDWLLFNAEETVIAGNIVVSEFTEQQTTLLIVINVLVLGFLFGERAVQNVMPIISRFLEAKKA